MWHAELGRSLPDLWSGQSSPWRCSRTTRARPSPLGHSGNGQRAWLRQLELQTAREMERFLLRIDRGGWTARRFRPRPGSPPSGCAGGCRRSGRGKQGDASLETAYCAELVAVTYQAMGLLPPDGSRTGMTLAGSGAGMISTLPAGPHRRGDRRPDPLAGAADRS